MPSLLTTSDLEPIARYKASVHVIVVCGTFFVLGYSVAFNAPHFPLEQASALDYIFALEPICSLLLIMKAVRCGWLVWSKEQYDRMKFPLSGAELLGFVAFVSGFCFLHQFSFPIVPDASGVNWTTYAVICPIAFLGLVWACQQGKVAVGKIGIWSVIWYALMMFAICADVFLNINMVSASRTERMALGFIHSKYSTTSSKGTSHYYYVHVTSPTNSNNIVSLAIDRATWDRVGKGDVIKLRFFRGGLGQDYWQYEH